MIFKPLRSAEGDAAALNAATPNAALRDMLAKIGAKLARHGRSIASRTAMAAVPRQLSAAIPAPAPQLRTPPVTA